MYRVTAPLTTPLKLLNPIIEKRNGRIVKIYPEDGEIIYTSFKSFGGTETVVNGVWTLKDTADIETWYRPDIKSDSRFLTHEGTVYEVIGTPENIESRNQFLKFKVEAVRGSSNG